MKNRLFAMIMVVCICICAILSSSIVAAAGLPIDLSAKGTLTVEILDPATGSSVKENASIEIFRVASLSEDAVFLLTEAYQGLSIDFQNLNAQKEIGIANDLMVYIKSNNIPPTSIKSSNTGEYFFDGLEVGMYLITYHTNNKNITVDSFLVTMPIWNAEKNTMNYNLHVYPKYGVKNTSTPSSSAPEYSNPPVSTPGLTTSSTIKQGSSKPGESTLPQTGMLQWPVPVLVVLGLILFSVGWAEWYRRRNYHE